MNLLAFYCCECEQFIDDPVRRTDSDPFGTGDSWYTETTYVCPQCYGEDIDERTPCDHCRERLPIEGYDDCLECIVENEDNRYEEEDIAAAKRDVANQRLVAGTGSTGSTEEGGIS